jgi:hypothetical protein
MGYRGVLMQDLACELPRILILRTRVNKGRKKAEAARPRPRRISWEFSGAPALKGSARLSCCPVKPLTSPTILTLDETQSLN